MLQFGGCNNIRGVRQKRGSLVSEVNENRGLRLYSFHFTIFLFRAERNMCVCCNVGFDWISEYDKRRDIGRADVMTSFCARARCAEWHQVFRDGLRLYGDYI